MRRILAIAACLAMVTATLACAADPDVLGGDGSGVDGGTAAGHDGELTRAQCTDGLDNDGDGLRDCADPGCGIWTECGGSEGRRDAGLDECASVTSRARATRAPADIVWIVDSSGSMTQEADLVQRNINEFAAQIDASGVSYRVVMITARNFVTVPPPLGTDEERFLFIEQPVGSGESLELLLARYDDYAPFLRDGAASHFVVVTDDESDLAEDDFLARMRVKLGHDFRFHAVASPNETHCDASGTICDIPGCEGPHGKASGIGARYYSLAGLTDGTTFSICAGDWSPLWDTLRGSIVVSATLPCEYDLPAPPAGETLASDRVNVAYTDSGASETVLPRAVDRARCDDAEGMPVSGWYYDDNEAPSRIILCPGACELVEAGGDGARLDIVLGCETETVLH